MFLLWLFMAMRVERVFRSAKTALLGLTPYAQEKISIEQNLQQLSVEMGFQLLILRPSGLFGFSDPKKTP